MFLAGVLLLDSVMATP